MSRDARDDNRDLDDDVLAPRRANLPGATSVERSPGGTSSQAESDAQHPAEPLKTVESRDVASAGREREPRDLVPIHRFTSPRREPLRWRHRTLRLRESESSTLQTIGTFRVVNIADLEQFAYAGDHRRLEANLRALQREGLVAPRRYISREGLHVMVTLTRDGHAVTQHASRDADQTLHWGWVKPKELAHDATVYRVYHAEAERIAREGGVVRRVVLDAELKGLVASALQRSQNTQDADERAPLDRQAAVAEAYRLQIVDGAMQIPDLRIEYETAQGDRTHVDVEVATEYYTLSQIITKARAGFTIYAPATRTERLHVALEDRGIITEILSL